MTLDLANDGALLIEHDDVLDVVVGVTDSVGNVNQTLATYTVDALAEPPTITVDVADQEADGTGSINATPYLYGTAEAGATLHITVDDGNDDSHIFTVTADALTGDWSLDLEGELSNIALDHDDVVSVDVVSEDRLGNVATTSADYTVDASIFTPTFSIADVDQEVDDTGSINATPHITGTAEGNVEVYVTLSDGTDSMIMTVTANDTGIWTLDLDGAALGDLSIEHGDDLSIAVGATDGVGNISGYSIASYEVDSTVLPASLSVNERIALLMVLIFISMRRLV